MHGPFAYVRHPMYTLTCLLAVAGVLGTQTLFSALIWPAFVAAVVRRIPDEEASLRTMFSGSESFWTPSMPKNGGLNRAR